jgi:hypothetical protein
MGPFDREVNSAVIAEGSYTHRENDPLNRLTRKQQFLAAVFISALSAPEKLFLICIWRYFDKDARSSSMSYQQIARDCSLDESTCKRIARRIAGTWLKIELHKGFLTKFGRTNLYHGIVPPNVLEDLRSHLGRQKSDGVAQGAPLRQAGVADGDPTGWHRTTRTSENTLDKKIAGVALVDGKPILHNGTRQRWEESLGGANQLDLALIEIAALPRYLVDPRGTNYAEQVEAQLARRARERQDRRSAQARAHSEDRLSPSTIRFAKPALEIS